MEKGDEAAENCDQGACRVRCASSFVQGPRSLGILRESPGVGHARVQYAPGEGVHISTASHRPPFPRIARDLVGSPACTPAWSPTCRRRCAS